MLELVLTNRGFMDQQCVVIEMFSHRVTYLRVGSFLHTKGRENYLRGKQRGDASGMTHDSGALKIDKCTQSFSLMVKEN